MTVYDRIAHIEIHFNVIEGHGNLITSTANGSLVHERTLTGDQVQRVKEALDAICHLGRGQANGQAWGMDIARLTEP